ncbi:MAG: response regulator [Ardenticatenaceae bacterium]|nr:response regulator [Ardenticatenaceae bacterium]
MNGNILVADDDEAIRELLRDLLESEGYEVDTAVDGSEALRKLGQQTPALVVLDLMMPGMDGLAFIQKLQERRLRSAVSIIALSANPRLGAQAEQPGVEGFLAKPVEPSVLLGVTARALARRTARSPHDESNHNRLQNPAPAGPVDSGMKVKQAMHDIAGLLDQAALELSRVVAGTPRWMLPVSPAEWKLWRSLLTERRLIVAEMRWAAVEMRQHTIKTRQAAVMMREATVHSREAALARYLRSCGPPRNC